MLRHTALVALALCLSPSWLRAQSTEFTVTAASADLHKFPSIGSPVIAHAPRGTVLDVTRELGSWVMISWPDAQDSGAYVHVSWGFVTRRVPSDQSRPAVITSSPPPAESVSRNAPSPPQSTRTVYVRPPTHIVGLGGRIAGSTLGFGATARAWSRDRLGIQLEASRYALGTTLAAGHATSMLFAPSVLYSWKDRVTDFVWFRPYVGAGAGLHHQTFRATATAVDSVSDNGVGGQVFGGSELTFASAPRFALSADGGYRWARAPFAPLEFGGLGFSVSGHWYVK